MVADREADLYALWALVPEPGIPVLGRIHHDRSLVGGGSLTTIARQWPLAGTRRMRLRERPGRPEREARLELRFGVATIARPRDAGAPELPAQVRLSLIELSEPDPPQARPATGERAHYLAAAHHPSCRQYRCRLADRRLVPGAMDYRTAVWAAQKTRIAPRGQPSRDRRATA